MKHLRSTTIFATLLLFLWIAFLSGHDDAQDIQDQSRLSEDREKQANEHQPPQLIMNLVGIRSGLVIGEVGAGRGRVTVHMADRVGANGRIYANDIDSAALEYLAERCRRLGLSNVEIVHGLVDDPRFPVNKLDLAFMAGVYNHLEKPISLLKNLMPSLKPWGVVVMVEPASSNPREKIDEEARQAGFQIESLIEGQLKHSSIFILRPMVPEAPESHDRQKVRALWLDYLEWAKNTQGRTSPREYAVSLESRGIPAPEVRRRLHVLRGQFTEQPEGIEMIYDPIYGKPLTGELEKDGFKTSPNAFLVEAMKGIPPGGQALDVGSGMGRNAIHLAGLGWDVTGIDLSAKGLEVMQANAEKAGLKVRTVKTSYEEFDFGKERWDLVAMILSWAPVEDAGFLFRLKESIRPGGYIVFEHNIQRSKNPFPPGVHALSPGLLRELFKDFEILIYQELNDYGDWGGPPIPHVRMVARKVFSVRKRT
ncbi:MAG: class I SAM-dependent methyltransferase [Candidatus Aminicenantes bacterium]|nr:class I SAM-dependent methyltransferase [Candidatus Aminicenantes bacterium]